jgi:23S rRNA pseudouridine2605 synthase
MKLRIQKLLASIGIDSRRHIEEMVADGRVVVNGKKVRRSPVIVDDETDTVELDGVIVYAPDKRSIKKQKAAGPVVIALNKPEKVVCTNVAQGEQLRAIDLLPPGFQTRVYPVGRLDAESRGLLLLTNDGELTNQLTHPKFGVTKTYRAIIDGRIGGEVIRQLMDGIWLAEKEGGKGFKVKASKVEFVKRLMDKSVIDITLEEGRNRQIRRMLARVGHKVRTLTRTRFGPLDLNKMKLKPGESRLLTPRELEMLRRAVRDTSALPNQIGKPNQPGKSNQQRKLYDGTPDGAAKRPRPRRTDVDFSRGRSESSDRNNLPGPSLRRIAEKGAVEGPQGDGISRHPLGARDDLPES